MRATNRTRPHLEELEARIVPTLSASTNWAGYAVATGAGAVSKVAGSWVVPAVTTSVAGYSSAWVGIDGYNSSSVEQIGTDSDYVNGVLHYYAWYEMYPHPSVNLSLTIRPGDAISASVSFVSPNGFALAITNVSTGGSFSTTQASSSAARSSAEWIQEAPSSVSGVLPLANFGTINFSASSATVSGTTGPIDNAWSGATVNQVNMVTNSGALKATTSAFTDSGSPPASSFSVTWVSSGASNGKGGHHKSPDAPLPPPAQTISVPSVATANVTNASSPSPAFVTTTSATTAALPAPAVAPTPPMPTALSATIAVFGGAPVQIVDEAIGLEVSLPSGHTAPVHRVTAPAADARAALPADLQSPAGPETTMQPASRKAASVGDAAWHGFNGDCPIQDIALAGALLAITFDRGWATTVERPTGKRDDRRRRNPQPELQHGKPGLPGHEASY